jgi:two-component system chemotaxis sensor kinase CheA
MQEVVLKSIEKNYRAIPGLSGASILGDGRVSLILDVDALVTMAAAGIKPRE